MEPVDWHRLFGLSWEDFFHGLPVKVELEKDLSLKQQFLDVVIVRLEHGPLSVVLPDGFDVLTTHNLISFKSMRETLDGWVLDELIGHYVNYRKQVSPNMRDLLPETDFRVFMVSTRYPQNLVGRVAMAEVSAGVYDIRFFSGTLRLIVIAQLPCEKQNAVLCMFSAREDQRDYGAGAYQLRSLEMTSFIFQLFDGYIKEGLAMPYNLAEIERQTREKLVDNLTNPEIERISVERRLAGISVEQVRNVIPVAQLLEGVPVEQRLEGIPVGRRLEGVPIEELVQSLSPEALQELLRAAERRSSTS